MIYFESTNNEANSMFKISTFIACRPLSLPSPSQMPSIHEEPFEMKFMNFRRKEGKLIASFCLKNAIPFGTVYLIYYIRPSLKLHLLPFFRHRSFYYIYFFFGNFTRKNINGFKRRQKGRS